MAEFSPTSKTRLAECHPLLQQLFNAVIENYDCTVICGHRGAAEQEEAFRSGRSKLQYPESKHNLIPSTAVDVVPFPIDWHDRTRFYHFVGFVRGVAASLGIKIRSGADWDGDMDLKDQNFFDLPHFELILEQEK